MTRSDAQQMLLERVRYHLDRAQQTLTTLLDEFARQEENRYENFYVACEREARRYFWKLWSILGHALLEHDRGLDYDEEVEL